MTTRAVVRRPRLWRLFRAPLRRRFDALASGWETRIGPEGLIPLVAALDTVREPPQRVLDLGTGTGRAARVIAERFAGSEVVGVDISPEMIEHAKELLPVGLADRVRFQVGDASALPFADASFDLVVLMNMIPFFGELARVTAPAGRVVFAFSFGADTPIYVPAETLRARLEPLGFGGFNELAAGEGNALLAAREKSP
jgi:malonyl-CoA O-methyltransferase